MFVLICLYLFIFTPSLLSLLSPLASVRVGAALAAGAHHNLLATMILFELFPYVHEFSFKNIINIV
jgi:hypothetical protein